MGVSEELPPDDPKIIAWEKLKLTPEFKNIVNWIKKGHYMGELWSIFQQGWDCVSKEESPNSTNKQIDAIARIKHILRNWKSFDMRQVELTLRDIVKATICPKCKSKKFLDASEPKGTYQCLKCNHVWSDTDSLKFPSFEDCGKVVGKMFDIDNLPFDTGNPDKKMSVRDCVLLMAKETPDKLADTVENLITEHHALLKKVAQNSTSNKQSESLTQNDAFISREEFREIAVKHGMDCNVAVGLYWDVKNAVIAKLESR